MTKVFYLPAEHRGTAKPLPEQEWFKLFQPLLVNIANTEYGRELLCIDKHLPPVIQLLPNVVHTLLEDRGDRFVAMSDFRTARKWANVIRSRWPEFKAYAKSFYEWEYAGVKLLVPVLARDGVLLAAAATDTFFPDPNPENDSLDGHVATVGVASTTWTDLVDDGGSFGGAASAAMETWFIEATTLSRWHALYRGILLFLTSSLGAAASIESATLSLYGNIREDGLSITPSVNIYASAPASNTALAANGDDFDTFGTTPFSADLAYADSTVGAYNDFILNAAGIAAIDPADVTKLGTRNANYDVARSAPSHTDGLRSRFNVIAADTAGTTQDPKLVVVTAGGPDVAPVMSNRDALIGAARLNTGGSVSALFASRSANLATGRGLFTNRAAAVTGRQSNRV